MKPKQMLLLAAILISFSKGYTQNIILTQTQTSGIYQKGQLIRVKLFLKDQHPDTVSVKIMENYSERPVLQNFYFKGDTLTIFERSYEKPVSVIFEAAAKKGIASIGLVVEPEKLQPGFSRPKDLNSFWNAEKTSLRALPMEVKSTPLPVTFQDYQCYDVEINCTGPKSVIGYYAKPVTAKPKSLPIVLFLHAAGVKGAWCRSEPGNALNYAKRGAICFDLNAHGMLNGQPQEYYVALENGELKGYSNQGVESKNDFYFRGMYLRIIRTLDFLTRQPEWDRKRILVIGQSQGGGQALAAAGLDHRVSAVVATLPAMCDWGGRLAGRKGGWPQPLENNLQKEVVKKVLPYFDTAQLLRGVKAKIFAEIGLIDVTCPATSVYAALNQAKGEKIIVPVPYRAHADPPVYYQKIWKENVDNQREEFIKNYLK